MKSSHDVVNAKGRLGRQLTFRQIQVLQTIAMFQKMNGGRSPSRTELCGLLELRHNQLFKALQGLYRREILIKAWRKPDFVITALGQQLLLGQRQIKTTSTKRE